MHTHHRQRLRDKVIKNVDVLNDYELLELLLFYVKPRVNTNDTAHRLIDTLGGIDKVFLSSPEELMKIDGVGEQTAVFLVTLGKVFAKSFVTKDDEVIPIGAAKDVENYLINLFSRYKTEIFIVFFLDKGNQITSKYLVGSHNTMKVDIDTKEIANQITNLSPASILIAHNHLSDNVYPGAHDDNATEQFYTLAMLNDVNLYDHIIVSGRQTFSYFAAGRLALIKRKINKLLFPDAKDEDLIIGEDEKQL